MLTFNSTLSSFISNREQKENKYCQNETFEVCNLVIVLADLNEFCNACPIE